MENTKKNECGCNLNQKHIEGIVCDVKNCIHHDCETHCTANQILVGPARACNSAETSCATFKPRNL